jgi:hypothetical protein
VAPPSPFVRGERLFVCGERRSAAFYAFGARATKEESEMQTTTYSPPIPAARAAARYPDDPVGDYETTEGGW